MVNAESGISTERQIFTVAHELGHLVLHTGSYQSPEEEENPVEEQEADRFAGNLLLPEESLRREWAATKGLHWVDAVLRIKKVYKVSYMTVLVRLKQVFPALKDRNLLLEFRVAYKNLHGHDLKDHYEPNAIEDLIVAKDDPDALGSNDLVEDRFSRLVREAYEQEEISLSRAAEILGRPLSDMRLLVKAWQEISPSV